MRVLAFATMLLAIGCTSPTSDDDDDKDAITVDPDFIYECAPQYVCDGVTSSFDPVAFCGSAAEAGFAACGSGIVGCPGGGEVVPCIQNCIQTDERCTAARHVFDCETGLFCDGIAFSVEDARSRVCALAVDGFDRDLQPNELATSSCDTRDCPDSAEVSRCQTDCVDTGEYCARVELLEDAPN